MADNENDNTSYEVSEVPQDLGLPLGFDYPIPQPQSPLSDMLELYENFPNLAVYPKPRHMTFSNLAATNTAIEGLIPEDALFGYFVADNVGALSLAGGDVIGILTGATQGDCILLGNGIQTPIVYLLNIRSFAFAFANANSRLSLVYWNRK